MACICRCNQQTSNSNSARIANDTPLYENQGISGNKAPGHQQGPNAADHINIYENQEMAKDVLDHPTHTTTTVQVYENTEFKGKMVNAGNEDENIYTGLQDQSTFSQQSQAYEKLQFITPGEGNKKDMK